ncbi:hypothetical protein [Streptomyces bluensis]|uniref:hypothetical protein n=1 Tax=Streptomyces bluensis TaxID=33897 RepID=UPI003333B51E
MARHSAPRPSTARRAVLALTTAGIGLGVGATGTAADSGPGQDPVRTRPVALGRIEPGAGARAMTGSVRHVTTPVETLKPNPLAGTGVDPLDNGAGTQVADFKPMTSRAVTRPVAQAPSVGGIPLLGQIPGLLHG